MSVKFTILGSGSSMGVPRADGFSGNCNLKNKKNFRTRCSALIQFNNQNILIDTSPDLRSQLLKNNITSISKVFYTHLHGDKTHEINNLRPFFLITVSSLNWTRSKVVNLCPPPQEQTLLLRIAVPSSVGLESTTDVSFFLQNGQIMF